MQIENEFGFIGPDETYIRHIKATAKNALRDEVILFTTDPPDKAAHGTLRDSELYTCVPPACRGSGGVTPKPPRNVASGTCQIDVTWTVLAHMLANEGLAKEQQDDTCSIWHSQIDVTWTGSAHLLADEGLAKSNKTTCIASGICRERLI